MGAGQAHQIAVDSGVAVMIAVAFVAAAGIGVALTVWLVKTGVGSLVKIAMHQIIDDNGGDSKETLHSIGSKVDSLEVNVGSLKTTMEESLQHGRDRMAITEENVATLQQTVAQHAHQHEQDPPQWLAPQEAP